MGKPCICGACNAGVVSSTRFADCAACLLCASPLTTPLYTPLTRFSFCQEQLVKSKVSTALENVRRILETTRDPQFPADVPHAYEDKFTLTEMACKGTIVLTLNALALVGLDEAALEGLARKVKDDKQRVSLVFAATERCAFNRSLTRDIESATQGVKETTGGMFGNKTTTYKTVGWLGKLHLTCSSAHIPHPPCSLAGQRSSRSPPVTSLRPLHSFVRVAPPSHLLLYSLPPPPLLRPPR